MCYAILDAIGLNPIVVQILSSCQSWPSLQQSPLGKNQSEIANHRPGKPDMPSQHASVKLDMLSWRAKHRQATPTCIAKVIYIRGCKSPEQQTSCGNQKNLIQRKVDKQRQQNSCGKWN